MPAFRSAAAPPLANLFGSLTPKTTFLMPDSIIFSVQGGVLPW